MSEAVPLMRTARAAFASLGAKSWRTLSAEVPGGTLREDPSGNVTLTFATAQCIDECTKGHPLRGKTGWGVHDCRAWSSCVEIRTVAVISKKNLSLSRKI